jgi:hypothetical protein
MVELCNVWSMMAIRVADSHVISDQQVVRMHEKPVCETCVAGDQRYSVTAGSVYTTAMATQQYWDEEGRYHFHNMNTSSQEFYCSNGHRWAEERKNYCSVPGCRYAR